MNDDKIMESFVKNYERSQKKIELFKEALQNSAFEEKHGAYKKNNESSVEISQVFSSGQPVYRVSEDGKNVRYFTSKKNLNIFLAD